MYTKKNTKFQWQYNFVTALTQCAPPCEMIELNKKKKIINFIKKHDTQWKLRPVRTFMPSQWCHRE